MDFDVNVISKSGTTLSRLSPSAFSASFCRKSTATRRTSIYLKRRTRTSGVLKELGDEFGWETFVVPDDVGGRYSVLSAVGLLPMAVAGIDVRKVIDTAIAEFSKLDDRGMRQSRVAVCRRAPAPLQERPQY